MTDDERFRLDQAQRATYDAAKADLSRARQLAVDYGRALEGLGKTLQELPQNVHLWKKENGAAKWRWTFSPYGQGLKEVTVPEWAEIEQLAHTIRRLAAEIPPLEQALRDRRLIE